MLDVVELSRLQFALTALYHFLFVPLTLGLSFILVIMETLYVATGKEVYKDMTKFWVSYLVLTLLSVSQLVLQWNSSLVRTGHIILIMWEIFLVCLLQLKHYWHSS